MIEEEVEHFDTRLRPSGTRSGTSARDGTGSMAGCVIGHRPSPWPWVSTPGPEPGLSPGES
jgi:hypothetical protein